MTRNEKDQRVVAALGTKFEQFRKLALMVAEQPASRPYAEAEMGRLLATMTDGERLELQRSLLAAGAYKNQRNRK